MTMSRGKFPLRREEYETVEEVLEYPIMAIEDRGISKETCERFGVRSSFCTERGKIVAHYFPGYEDGKVVGFKKRDLTKPKKDSFSVVGKLSKETTEMFMQPKCQRGGLKLFIAEGEYDGLALWQTLMHQQPTPGKYVPNVASPFFGAVSSDKQIEAQEEFINSFKNKVAVYDNDEAGIEGVTKLSFVYEDLLYVPLSKNDCCEVVEKEGAMSLYKQAMFNATTFVPDTVLEEALPDEELFAGWNVVANITTFPKLNELLGGVRGGEMSVFIADTGVGKSTVYRHLMLDMIDQGLGTDNIFLEEGPVKTQLSLLCLKYGLDIVKVSRDPSTIPQEQRNEMREWLNSTSCKWIKKPKNSKALDKKQILHRLKWDVIQKVPVVFLDHLTWLLYDDSSLGAVDSLLREMADIVEGSDTHLNVIVHANRSSKKNKHLLKEEDFPFWDKLDKSSGRSSGAIEQVAWNIMVGESLVLNEDWDLGKRRLRLIKNRNGRSTGVADEFSLDLTTGKYKVY